MQETNPRDFRWLLRIAVAATPPPRRPAALQSPAASCRTWGSLPWVPPPIIPARDRRAQAV